MLIWGSLEKIIIEILQIETSSTATVLFPTVLTITLFLLHITKRVKMLKTDFLISFFVSLLERNKSSFVI